MMNAELIKEVALLGQKLHECGGVISADIGLWGVSIHVHSFVLLEEKELVFSESKSADYPYKVSVKKEGVTLFALLEPKEISKFQQFKEKVKTDLLQRIQYLEEDVQLDGMPEGDRIA